MNYPPIFSLCYTLFIVLLFSSCGVAPMMQTGKTVPKGKTELGAGIHLTERTLWDQKNLYMGGQFSVRRGVGSKLDIGTTISAGTGLLADIKWQFVGDQNSRFAVATGFGASVGIEFDAGIIYDFHLPLYMSMHPSEKLEVFMNPRVVMEGAFWDNPPYSNNPNLGGSVGFSYGKRFKIGMEVSYFEFPPDESFYKRSRIQAGVGIKYRF